MIAASVDPQVNNQNLAELETTNSVQRAALVAVKEECAAILREKSELLQRLSELALNGSMPSREEIEKSEPYKSLQAQVEHLSSEVARLEAIAEKLREENMALVSDRTKFKEDLITEHKVALDEANAQILRIEKDLTRVRGVRDELHVELQNRKARDDETLHSAREISEIADSREVAVELTTLTCRCGSCR